MGRITDLIRTVLLAPLAASRKSKDIKPWEPALCFAYVGSMADYYYEARKQDKLLRKHAKENKVTAELQNNVSYREILLPIFHGPFFKRGGGAEPLLYRRVYPVRV